MKKIIISGLMLVISSLLLAQQKPSFRDYLDKTNSLVPNLVVPHKSYTLSNKTFTIPNEKSLPGVRSKRPMTLDDATWCGRLPNGNQLYRLPMDNMICIVPDISQFHMPVVG